METNQIPESGVRDRIDLMVQDGRISVETAKDLRERVLAFKSKGAPSWYDALHRAAPDLFDDLPVESRETAHAALAQHVTFSKPWHYDLVLLWAAQTHFRDILPTQCCVNLAFSGAKSSGKTKATEIALRVADGEMLAGGTPAALIRTFDRAKAVGIDELDSTLKRYEDLEGILRVGNKWDALYRVCSPGPGGAQRPVDLKVGGPKAFNYRSDIEDALKSRTYVIEMPRQTNARQVVNNLFLDNPTSTVLRWLGGLCGVAVKKWTRRSVEAHMKDERFVQRLRSLPAGIARNLETAAVFLLISDLLGWDLDAEVRNAVEAQTDEETTNEPIRELLLEMYQERVTSHDPDLEIPQSELLGWLNARLDASKAPRLTSRSFARVRREFGFEDGINVLKRRTAGGKRYLRFDARVREALGAGTSA